MKKLISLFFIFHFSFFILKAQYLLYGTTSAYYDASHHFHYGTIYSYAPSSNKQTTLFNFNGTNGSNPIGRMLYASDSLLYGMTAGGGTNSKGTLFSFNPKNNIETVLVNFNGTNGEFQNSGLNELIQAKDSLLYGTTYYGGANNIGVLFSYNIKTNKDSIRCVFNDSTSFNGFGPYMELWQDMASGILYGATERGGFPGGGGVIYEFNPKNNKLTRPFVATLSSTGPWEFSSGFTKVNDSLLYGMSQVGGMQDSGTIYSFNLNTHTVKVVLPFNGKMGGGYPNGDELVQLSDGLLYGCANNGTNSGGILFSFNPINNTEKTLVTFAGSNGSVPEGRLVQDPDNGLLYGVTLYGGDSNYGVLFSYDTINSIYTKLLDFKGSNGRGPQAGLTLVDTGKKDVGVGELRTKSEEVRVFPNPSGGKFTIQTEVLNEPVIEVYNIFGQKIYQTNINANAIDVNLENQPNGVYFYRVVSYGGGLVGDGKIVIQK